MKLSNDGLSVQVFAFEPTSANLISFAGKICQLILQMKHIIDERNFQCTWIEQFYNARDLNIDLHICFSRPCHMIGMS